MRPHPVVRQSAPHPGNNLVANWLEDGENWKLKLEILIINREEGEREKKVRGCGAAMRQCPPGKWGFLFVMKCMWHASPTLQGYQSQEEGGQKRLPSNLRLQKILWCSWKFVLCPCGVVFCFFSPSCVTFLDSLICHALDMSDYNKITRIPRDAKELNCMHMQRKFK